MTPVTRRKFLGGALLTGGALTSTLVLPDALAGESKLAPSNDHVAAIADDEAASNPIDFRFSPPFVRPLIAFQMIRTRVS